MQHRLCQRLASRRVVWAEHCGGELSKVDLWPEPNREDNVFGSKAVGEPPFMLAISVFEALRDAVAQARGDRAAVTLQAPATAEAVLNALNAGQ